MQEHHEKKITPKGIILGRMTTSSKKSYQTKDSAAPPRYYDLAHLNLLVKEKNTTSTFSFVGASHCIEKGGKE